MLCIWTCGSYLCRSTAVSCPEGVFQKKKQSPRLISTRRRKLSIKAVLLEMTTKKWDNIGVVSSDFQKFYVTISYHAVHAFLKCMFEVLKYTADRQSFLICATPNRGGYRPEFDWCHN